MTITKQDLDNWIERDAYQKFPPQFASDQPGYDRAKYSREQYIEAAQLLAPLLLSALSALHEAVEHTSSNLEDMEHYFDNKCCPTMDELNQVVIADSNLRIAIGQIEAAVASAGKDETKELK